MNYWQDEANHAGGKWIIRLKKGLASRCWENLILAMLGEQFMVGEEICGAVISVRYQVVTSTDNALYFSLHKLYCVLVAIPDLKFASGMDGMFYLPDKLKKMTCVVIYERIQ
jgi:Eukaryotic initiation factor 4E